MLLELALLNLQPFGLHSPLRLQLHPLLIGLFSKSEIRLFPIALNNLLDSNVEVLEFTIRL